MLYAEDLAERFIERDTRDLAERAAADRDWTYRHVVVDEAQELSEMDWRVLMRRCPGRSFTVVGDLAQRRSAAGATSWDAMLEPYVPGRWMYRSLIGELPHPGRDHDRRRRAARRVRARGPAAGVGPRLRGRALVQVRRLRTNCASLSRNSYATKPLREGTSVVIGPPDVPGAVLPSETKGLEFDAVLVVEPERILADGPRAAQPSCTSRSPAPPSASASCTAHRCRRSCPG